MWARKYLLVFFFGSWTRLDATAATVADTNVKSPDGKRRYRHWRQEDAERWAEAFSKGKSILQIGRDEKVDQKVVSMWLHRLGVDVYQGKHHVEQLPLNYSSSAIALLTKGGEATLNFVEARVWGINATEKGIEQLRKFCTFMRLHREGFGVGKIAVQLGVHRTTISKWTERRDQPYLVRAATIALGVPTAPELQAIPLHLDSGGNRQDQWIRVPIAIRNYDDILALTDQLRPLERSFERAKQFRLSKEDVQRLKTELFAYLLGMLLGDASKSGGPQERFASMNFDLQLTKKRESNQGLGDFVCLCANCLGLRADRIRDKPPTGDTRLAQEPTAAFRWSSERSPLIAWMFSTCLGLDWNQSTSHSPVHMEWIFTTPFEFRKRFAQALADSDGSVKKYVVEITSVPNAEFVTKLLKSLGLNSAYTRSENGLPLRSVVRATEAADLPIINEFTDGYRFHQLMRYKRA